MTRTLAGAACCLWIVALAVVIPAERLLSLTSDPEGVHALLDSETLYQIGVAGTAREIQSIEQIEILRGTRLEINLPDLHGILSREFGQEQTDAKARQIVRELRDWVRAFPEEGGAFHIPVEDERPVLAREIEGELLERLRAGEECGLGDQIRIGWEALRDQLGDGRSDIEVLRDLPDCRPPDPVLEPIEDQLQERMAELAEEGPASIRAFPDDPDDADFVGLMERISTLERWVGQRGFVWTGLLLLALLATAMGAPRWVRPWRRLTRRASGVRAGLALLAPALATAGVAVGISGLLLASHSTEEFLRLEHLTGLGEEAPSESRVRWLGLAFTAIGRVTARAGWESVGVGAALLLAGVGLGLFLSLTRREGSQGPEPESRAA